MRIAVMAAGAVGGYFGARLAAAGHDVVFFARGAHLAAIRENGLKIESPRGNLHLTDVNVTDSSDGLAAVDAVLFAVKLWDSEKAAEQLKPLIGPNTRVISGQNGIDTVAMVEPIVGQGKVVPGLAQINTTIASPGVIVHSSQYQLMAFGHPDNRPDPTLAALVDAGKGAKVDFVLSQTIEHDLWLKFIILVAVSSVTASTRQPIGVSRGDPDGKKLIRAIMEEVIAVGRARGVQFGDDIAEKASAYLNSVPEGAKASMAYDLDRGNRLELDWLAGRVTALGRELNVPTPACETIYAVLKPYRNGKS